MSIMSISEAQSLLKYTVDETIFNKGDCQNRVKEANVYTKRGNLKVVSGEA